jgi:hypothetical protein
MRDCKFCDKTGLLILPLRYAAVVDEAAASFVPPLPGTLGSNVQDIALTHGRYAPRLLRNGYLYTLIQREGIKYWEGYVVIEDAFLYKFPVDNPPKGKVEFSCDDSTCGIDASCISVPKVEKVDKMYFLFTPSAMTTAKLDEYKAQADAFVAKGKMQIFDPKGWALAGNRSQTHSLKPELLDQHAPEWLLYKQCEKAVDSPLGKAMSKQLFPAGSGAYAGLPPPAPDQPPPGRLGALQHKLEKLKGACFAVFDHIGITQELNDFRNAAFARIEAFLEKTDNFQVSNQRKLTVHEHIQRVRVGLQSGLVASAMDSADLADLKRRAMVEPIFPDDTAQMRGFKMSSNNAYTHPSRTQWEAENPERVARLDAAYESDLKTLPERAKAQGEREWKERYLPLLDEPEMKSFMTALDAVIEAADRVAESRADDHLRWVTADRLIDAFDTFDRNDAADGHPFESESALCTIGMTGTPKSAAQVEAWVRDFAVSRSNLYMRGHYLNQLELERAAQQAMPQLHTMGEAAPEPAAMPATAVAAALKKTIDIFKKVDSAYDEWARNHQQYPNWSKREAAIFAKISEASRFIFRTGSVGVLDKGLAAVVGALLYSRLGELAETIQKNEFLLQLDESRLARPDLGQKKINKATTSAEVRARKAASKIHGSMLVLIEDMRQKVRTKANLSLAQLRLAHAEIDRQKAAGIKKPSVDLKTNNYHQARMGVAMAGLEMIGLAGKMRHFPAGLREWTELGGSILSLLSVSCDVVYASAKSIREIRPYSAISGIEKAGDVVRGGWKLTAGSLSVFAGCASLVLDVLNLKDEFNGKKRGMLFCIYASRSYLTVRSIWFGAVAAFSYAGPWLSLAAERAKRAAAGGVMRAGSISAAKLTAWANVANNLKNTRVLLLLRVARFNALGLLLTGVELAYFWHERRADQQALEEWCKMSTFRRTKSAKSLFGVTLQKDWYSSESEEVAQLELALARSQH